MDSEEQPRRKPIPGFILVAMVILLLVVQMQRWSVEHNYCEGEVPVPGGQVAQQGELNWQGAPDVLMLGAVWCPYCKAAIRFFDAHEINYCEYDIETSAIGSRLYDAVGGRGVPVLLIGGHRIYGYDEGMVRRALEDAGLWKS